MNTNVKFANKQLLGCFVGYVWRSEISDSLSDSRVSIFNDVVEKFDVLTGIMLFF